MSCRYCIDNSTSVKMDDEEEMSVATKFLMVVYIGVAILLSMVPFCVYLYITCKKIGATKWFKKIVQLCQKVETPDDITRNVDEISWPYPRRNIDEEVGIPGDVFFINLPSYDDAMKYKTFYKITNDTKAFYVVHNDHSIISIGDTQTSVPDTPSSVHNTPTSVHNTPSIVQQTDIEEQTEDVIENVCAVNYDHTQTSIHNTITSVHNTSINVHNTPTNVHCTPTSIHNRPTIVHNTPTIVQQTDVEE